MNDNDAIDIRRGEERSTLLLIRRAIANGWQVPEAMLDAAPKIAAKIALEGRNDRERLRAIEVLSAMRRDNIDALQSLDKIERLESDKNTENIGVTVRFVNKIHGGSDD